MNKSKFKILIAEDSVAIAFGYKTRLESQGHTVFVAIDGKTELDIYEKEFENCPPGETPFDLILSDNSMPGMNGTDAGKKILELVPNQKFFFVTGEKDLILDAFHVDGKNIDVEQKPFDIDLLMEKIKNMLKN